MNYEQARQIGRNGSAPGKWNWSNANDSIAPTPYTAPPCWQPEAGRERCDHDTQEEAERHHYEYDLAQVRIAELDLDAIRDRRRCDFIDCPNWETHHARWPGGYVVDSLCAEHAMMDWVRVLHPFMPGMREMHS